MYYYSLLSLTINNQLFGVERMERTSSTSRCAGVLLLSVLSILFHVGFACLWCLRLNLRMKQCCISRL